MFLYILNFETDQDPSMKGLQAEYKREYKLL